MIALPQTPSLPLDAVRSPDKMLVHPCVGRPGGRSKDVFKFARHRFQTEPQKKSRQTKKLYSL